MLSERAVRSVIGACLVRACDCLKISYEVHVLVSMRRSVNIVADRCARR